MAKKTQNGPRPKRHPSATQLLGRAGEDYAARYLEGVGYRILDRNWRCRHGEIDIVATRDGQLAFVEVKTRTSDAFGHPFEAITAAKLQRMHLLARLWRTEQPAHLGTSSLHVIGILAPAGVPSSVQHLEGVHA